MIGRDGQALCFHCTANVALRDENGNPTAVIEISRDITGRKQAEEALHESERFLKTVFNSIQDGISVLDPKLNVVRVNQTMRNWYAHVLPLEGKKCYEVYHGRSRPCHTCPTIRALDTGKPQMNEVPLQGEEGEPGILELFAFPLIDDSGNSIGVVEYVRNVTDRKRAEAAIRESEERFRTLVEESPLGISLIGKDGRYKYVNPRFQEMFGYTIDDTPTGREWFRKAYPDVAYRRSVMESWLGDQRQTGVWQSRPHNYTVTCKDGSRKEIHFRPVTMKNLDQFVIYEDITDRWRFERMLQESQKFEAIGTLAGGIAHDFNNLLMGIQGRASLMLVDLEPSHPHSEHIKAIEDCIRSATGLTKQLLGYARGGQYEVRPIDINELLLGSATMFGRTKKETHIHTKLQKPPPVVAADRRQIEQVLLNLYVNAWQAMPEGGELYLETKTVTLDDVYCKPYQAKPGRYARVSVTDTGIGMDESTRQRVFDPFFTTKDKGRGTGLGLASAYGIIKNHAGIITVDSEVGQGTKFNIYLPISDKEVYREVPTGTGLVKGLETILLVEDEEVIIDVGKAMLEKLGCRVVVAKDGEQAVDTVIEKGDGIDLVILDLIMPGMGGGKAFGRIRKIQPAMPVILSSGYSLSGQANDIMRRGCNDFIQKPFNISELSQKVRKILDEAKGPAKN